MKIQDKEKLRQEISDILRKKTLWDIKYYKEDDKGKSFMLLGYDKAIDQIMELLENFEEPESGVEIIKCPNCDGKNVRIIEFGMNYHKYKCYSCMNNFKIGGD